MGIIVSEKSHGFLSSASLCFSNKSNLVVDDQIEEKQTI